MLSSRIMWVVSLVSGLQASGVLGQTGEYLNNTADEFGGFEDTMPGATGDLFGTDAYGEDAYGENAYGDNGYGPDGYPGDYTTNADGLTTDANTAGPASAGQPPRQWDSPAGAVNYAGFGANNTMELGDPELEAAAQNGGAFEQTPAPTELGAYPQGTNLQATATGPYPAGASVPDAAGDPDGTPDAASAGQIERTVGLPPTAGLGRAAVKMTWRGAEPAASLVAIEVFAGGWSHHHLELPPEGLAVPSTLPNRSLIRARDLTFDGYADFALPLRQDVGALDQRFAVFVYLPAQRRFQYSEPLSALRSPRLDPLRRRIESWRDDGFGGAAFTRTAFAVDPDGTLRRVAQVSQTVAPGGRFLRHRVVRRFGGQGQVTDANIICRMRIPAEGRPRLTFGHWSACEEWLRDLVNVGRRSRRGLPPLIVAE